MIKLLKPFSYILAIIIVFAVLIFEVSDLIAVIALFGGFGAVIF